MRITFIWFSQKILAIIRSSSGSVRIHTIAWLLFLVCGIIYLAASVRDGDILMAAGSVCFLVAVIIFLLPGK